MITFDTKGDWSKTTKFLEFITHMRIDHILQDAGEKGVQALSSATPVDSGRAASSWYYTYTNEKDYANVTWYNDDIEGGCNVAILIQYGHATKNGGYVEGIDYINPAIKPIFDNLANTVWREVVNA